jgi:hypothetical protein
MLNFGQQHFDWVDLDSVLSKWQLLLGLQGVGVFNAVQ